MINDLSRTLKHLLQTVAKGEPEVFPVLNGKAIALPAPTYPDIARRMRQAGKVEVEVIVDENGKVISARATTGPTVLRDVAVDAALRARFTPTKLSGQPVKISGRIDYNFTLP